MDRANKRTAHRMTAPTPMMAENETEIRKGRGWWRDLWIRARSFLDKSVLSLVTAFSALSEAFSRARDSSPAVWKRSAGRICSPFSRRADCQGRRLGMERHGGQEESSRSMASEGETPVRAKYIVAQMA